jgi:hypothetical protein
VKDVLQVREWAIVAFIMGLILACSGLSWVTRHQTKANTSGWISVSESREEIEIEVVGAVALPGKYHFFPGVTLKEVLKAAGISKQADRKKINFKKIIYISERVEIPYKQKKPRIKTTF